MLLYIDSDNHHDKILSSKTKAAMVGAAIEKTIGENKTERTEEEKRSSRHKESRKSRKERRRSSEKDDKRNNEKDKEEEDVMKMPDDWTEIKEKGIEFRKINKMKEKSLKLTFEKSKEKEHKRLVLRYLIVVMVCLWSY